MINLLKEELAARAYEQRFRKIQDEVVERCQDVGITLALQEARFILTPDGPQKQIFRQAHDLAMRKMCHSTYDHHCHDKVFCNRPSHDDELKMREKFNCTLASRDRPVINFIDEPEEIEVN